MLKSRLTNTYSRGMPGDPHAAAAEQLPVKHWKPFATYVWSSPIGTPCSVEMAGSSARTKPAWNSDPYELTMKRSMFWPSRRRAWSKSISLRIVARAGKMVEPA